jgi:hypothetical protein
MISNVQGRIVLLSNTAWDGFASFDCIWPTPSQRYGSSASPYGDTDKASHSRPSRLSHFRSPEFTSAGFRKVHPLHPPSDVFGQLRHSYTNRLPNPSMLRSLKSSTKTLQERLPCNPVSQIPCRSEMQRSGTRSPDCGSGRRPSGSAAAVLA